jgi:hypothetical protein
MRLVTMLLSTVGFFACLATAGTGIYYGPMGHKEIKELHLNIAVGCVFVSLLAHAMAFFMLKKSGK